MKKYRIMILLTVGIIFLAVGYFFLFNGDTLEVSTMKSYKTNITKTIEVSGTIDSSDIEVIYPDTGKTAVKTYIKENEMVQKNQLLADLDSDDLYISLEKAKLYLEDNLDFETTENVYAILRDINQKFNTTFLIITHDQRIAEKTDRIVQVKDGRINLDVKK